MLTHKQKVRHIADRIRSLRSNRTLVRVYHGSTNSTRTLRFRKKEIVDISDLNRVVQINREKRSLLVEPNVPMDKLVSETIKHGFIPAVVPEFPGITIGGAIAGGSGESSSFRYGLVHNLALSYEIVLGSGEIIHASPDSYSDIFYGIGGTCGSLGIITCAEISLIPTTRYVRLEYIPAVNQDDLIEKIITFSHSPADFVDAILFSEARAIVMVGYRTDAEENLRIRRFSRSWDEWFYLHAKELLSRGGGCELIPLKDYLFRYDRGAFWMGNYAFQTFGVPNNHLTRFLLNPLLKTRMMYKGLQESNVGQEYIIQDVSVSRERISKLLKYINSYLKVYPLWLLPISAKAFCNTNIQTENDFIINAGIWSSLKLPYEEFVKVNIRLEEVIAQLNGCKVPYAHFYADERFFWKNLKKKSYEKLRKKYKADKAFPSIYDKIRVRERYKPAVKKGFFRAIRPRWRLLLS